MAAVSCRGLLVVRWYEVSRVLTVSANLAPPRKYKNQTWCRRWWHISQRGLSTTVSAFTPSLCPILMREKHHTHESKSSKGAADTKLKVDEPEAPGISVVYHRGLSRVTVPLPSRKESAVFTLRPVTHTVGDFLKMLKAEDQGIDRAVIKRLDGTRIASSNTIENLMEENFILEINDVEYTVNVPMDSKYTLEDMQKLSDVQMLVNQLYESFNVQEYNAEKERRLLLQLEEVRAELEPLDMQIQSLMNKAQWKSQVIIWACLLLMSIQFGALARLTWWDYSWDIMEPVTYFVTYGTTMAWFIYFLITKEEYILPDMVNRRRLLALHKHLRKASFDVNYYNSLKEKAYELETALKIIRGPLFEHRKYLEPKAEPKAEPKFDRSSSSSSRSPSSSPSPSPERTFDKKKQHYSEHNKPKSSQNDSKLS